MKTARNAMLALTFLSLLSGTAVAHSIQYPKRDFLEFSPGHITLSLSLDIEGGEEASRLRGRFDRNGDGALDQDEAELLQGFLAKEGQRGVTFTVNGQAPALHITSVSGHGTGLPLNSRDHMGVFVVLEGTLPGAPEIQVSFSDHTEEGMRRVPLQVTLKGLGAEGGSAVKVESGTSGETVLKGIMLEAGKPWAASLRTRDETHGSTGGRAHLPARRMPIRNGTP